MPRSASLTEAPATLFEKHKTQSAFSQSRLLLQNGHPR
jgi:hypothetical protein